MIRSAMTISLHVPDVADAVAFYGSALGFHQTGQWVEDGVTLWAEVTRDAPDGVDGAAARLWFYSDQSTDRPEPALTGVIYLFVDDVDAEAARLQGRVTIAWGPEDQPYGLRELGVRDPWGYLLCLARDISE